MPNLPASLERGASDTTLAFVDSVWFWQRSTCYSPKDKDEVFAPSIHVVRVSTKSLKILIAALSSSVAY